MAPTLTPKQQREVFRRIAAWRLDPARAVPCPACEAPGLGIIDRSARPYAEWYSITCAACGLDQTVHQPMSGPPPGAE